MKFFRTTSLGGIGKVTILEQRGGGLGGKIKMTIGNRSEIYDLSPRKKGKREYSPRYEHFGEKDAIGIHIA